VARCSLGSLRLPPSSEDPSEAALWVSCVHWEHALLSVPPWHMSLLVIASSFYKGLVLSGGSVSDFWPNFCFALEAFTSMFAETDNFFED
jgi:hypothetical protein